MSSSLEIVKNNFIVDTLSNFVKLCQNDNELSENDSSLDSNSEDYVPYIALDITILQSSTIIVNSEPKRKLTLKLLLFHFGFDIFCWITDKCSESTNLLTLSSSNNIDDIDQSTNIITTKWPVN